MSFFIYMFSHVNTQYPPKQIPDKVTGVLDLEPDASTRHTLINCSQTSWFLEFLFCTLCFVLSFKAFFLYLFSCDRLLLIAWLIHMMKSVITCLRLF